MADEELRLQIQQMVAASLVVEESADQLAFRHALTREAVYSTLLRSERRRFHQLVAEAMQHTYLAHSGTLDAHLADLAYHFYEAEAWEPALDYAERAGRRALSVFASKEAAGYFTRALDAAEHLGLPDRTDLYHARGQAHEALGDFESARTDFEEERECARAVHDGAAEWQSLIDLGFLWAGRDYQHTGDYFRQAVSLARTLPDPKVQAHSLNRLGNWLANTGSAAESIQAHYEALAVFRARADRAGEAETLDLLCFAHGMFGDLPRAVASGSQAVALFRVLDDQQGLFSALTMRRAFSGSAFAETTYGLLDTLESCERDKVEILQLARLLGSPADIGFAGISLCHQLAGYGEFGRALAQGRESLRFARDIAHQQWVAGLQYTLGYAYFWLLEPERAIAELQPALALARTLGSAWWVGHITAYLALAFVQKGERMHAEEVLRAAFELDQTPRSMPERRMAWAWGELALAQDKPAMALAIAERLLGSAPAEGAPPAQSIPNLWKLKGEALLALGRTEEALQALERAKEGAMQRGARPLLWQVHRSLARLHRRQQQAEQAARETAAAREVIDALAATIDEEPLKERFVRAAVGSLDGQAPN
jgi:tetratricopeptide (TPR) repeat protein